MSRLELNTENRSVQIMDRLVKDMGLRLAAGPPGACPIDMAHSFTKLCHSQSCGKCVPCRIGLGQLADLLTEVMDGEANEQTLRTLKETAAAILDSADCVIGYDAARITLDAIEGFEDDFHEHITKGRCIAGTNSAIPCMSNCPAAVDIPGYIALTNEGQYEDAVRLIRKDNPFPISCGFICERPCETLCRRGMIDYAVNIRGIKNFATERAGFVPPPQPLAKTGKRVAIIGGGPGGLTAAYYLSLMGHSVTVFERRSKLGGMLRYGIPSYRLPRNCLDNDIEAILQTGIEVKLNTDIGSKEALDEVINSFDSTFIAIGAHTDSKARLKGEDSNGVISAVELLRSIGDGSHPDFTSKTIVVVGGGNVAMDAARSSLRLGAKKVYCVYRRRREDMTALADEVDGAVAEGVELVTLRAPVKIEEIDDGNLVSIALQPQLPGELDEGKRPKPINADLPQEHIKADLIVMAIGQKVETAIYEEAGYPIKWGALETSPSCEIIHKGKVFAGGDCSTGPSAAIMAIAAGKTAAANIDDFLGFNHRLPVNVDIPPAKFRSNILRGRVGVTERNASERKNDFSCVEQSLTQEGAEAESARCLRCDHYGYGSFRNRRCMEW